MKTTKTKRPIKATLIRVITVPSTQIIPNYIAVTTESEKQTESYTWEFSINPR